MSLSPWTPLRTLIDRTRMPRATRRRRDHARRQHLTEALEPRTMLTTVISTAGSPDTIFEYSPDVDLFVRMRISGNVSMEILGARVSGLNQRATIGPISGRLTGPNQPPNDIAGGIGGPGGI